MSDRPIRSALALLALVLAACTAPAGLAPQPAATATPPLASPTPFPSASFIAPTLRLEDLRALIRVPIAAKGRAQPVFTRAESEAHFEEHDLNGDGELSKPEWERLHEAADAPPEVLDADGDGAVQAAEFHAYVLQSLADGGSDGGTVQALTDAGFAGAIADGKLTVVHFYAVWCGPCRLVAPIFTELATANPGVRVAKLDVDANPTAATTYNIRSIPTVLYFKGGQVVDRLIGAAPRSSYQVKIDALK